MATTGIASRAYDPAMPRSRPVDGFSLAYDRTGDGPPVVLLHGWPGDRRDYAALVPLLLSKADVTVPDLRGFGESDKHAEPPEAAYSAQAQVRGVLALMDELGLESAVLVGYDFGSVIAQSLARAAPERVRALVVAPPLPGVGRRVLDPVTFEEFWYQALHRLELGKALVDGNPDAVRAYLRHFWSHWSGPSFAPSEAALDGLVEAYSPPGAFTASIAWYRAGRGIAAWLSERDPDPAERTHVATSVLWPEHDPLFPFAWSDRLDAFFSDVVLEPLPGVGHFVPLEAPEALAAAIGRRLG